MVGYFGIIANGIIKVWAICSHLLLCKKLIGLSKGENPQGFSYISICYRRSLPLVVFIYDFGACNDDFYTKSPYHYSVA